MYMLLTLVIVSGGHGGYEKIVFQNEVNCQKQASVLNEKIDWGARYYAFCYPVTQEEGQ